MDSKSNDKPEEHRSGRVDSGEAAIPTSGDSRRPLYEQPHSKLEDRARALGMKGYEHMSEPDLAEAIRQRLMEPDPGRTEDEPATSYLSMHEAGPPESQD